MAEELRIPSQASKQEKYQALIPQLQALLSQESDLTANLANVSAALRMSFGFFWVGFYLVKDDMLVLGPFQGDIACTRIPFGKGVCGSSYTQQRTLLVPDVDAFPGHIACSSLSRSEIVVPVFDTQGHVRMVLDVDSDQLNDFDTTDQQYLEELARMLGEKL